MKERQPLLVQITPGTLLFGIVAVAIAWLLYEIRSIIPIILASLVFAAALEPR